MSIFDETWWGREVIPPQLNAFFRRCCTFFKSDPMGGGTKGNAAHTYGRHRSVEWCLHSAFCTDRTYGTKDKRDRDGNPQHIRAVDVKLTRTQIREVSHRLDIAVRTGNLPQVAEWFGTFDNTNVVGWYEGHASSADDSHLEHVHVGVWTIYADDQAALNEIYDVMTGAAMALDAADARTVWGTDGFIDNPGWRPDAAANQFIRPSSGLEIAMNEAHNANARAAEAVALAKATAAKVDQILAAVTAGVVVNAEVNLTDEAVAKVADATADEIHADPERDGV